MLLNGECKKQVSMVALRICRRSLQDLQETSTARIARVSTLMEELAQSLAKVEENLEIEQPEPEGLQLADMPGRCRIRCPRPARPSAGALA
jgi:hypothetical protein